MKKITCSPLPMFLLVAAFLFSASSARPEQDSGKHFLWRVTNATQPFYLLGSFHALHGSDYPLGHEIDDAIGQSKRFVFEYDFEHVDEAKFSRQLNDQAHYPAGTTLKQKVHPETYAYVQKIAKIRASRYNDVKPWAIAFYMMSHRYYYNLYGYYGVEGYVWRKARAFADIGGLETADEHLHVLSDMNDIEAEVFLLQTFVYSDRTASNLSKEIATYKRGDTEGLAAFSAQQDREAPFLTWRLVDHRNAQWIPRIENEIKSGKPTMIVVGARHLCGAHNVISMLQAKGYKLEQL